VRITAHAMKVTAVAAGLAFPPAAPASPAGLAAIIRSHWMIEDRLHWVRDLDFDEDRS
jgi:predicted transposase YbfD/YdcC